MAVMIGFSIRSPVDNGSRFLTSGRGLLTDGGYGKHGQFHYYEFRGMNLAYKAPVDVVFDGKTLSFNWLHFRGSKAVLVDNCGRLFCREIL